MIEEVLELLLSLCEVFTHDRMGMIGDVEVL